MSVSSSFPVPPVILGSQRSLAWIPARLVKAGWPVSPRVRAGANPRYDAKKRDAKPQGLTNDGMIAHARCDNAKSSVSLGFIIARADNLWACEDWAPPCAVFSAELSAYSPLQLCVPLTLLLRQAAHLEHAASRSLPSPRLRLLPDPIARDPVLRQIRRPKLRHPPETEV